MSDAKRLFKMDSTGMVSSFRPATPDEIMAAHPKCATCAWLIERDESPHTICGESESRHVLSFVLPDFDYCRHHTPKEQSNG